MTHEVVQVCASRILYSPKVGSHNQAMSGLWSIPAMNHDWKLFRRPLADSVFQKPEWTQIPGLGEGTVPGTVHTDIPRGSFQDLCLLCLLCWSPPICCWCLFYTFLPSSGLHKIFVDCFSVSSALLLVFCTVPVAFPPSATVYHHLPLIFGVPFLAELHHHVGILDDPKTYQSLHK